MRRRTLLSAAGLTLLAGCTSRAPRPGRPATSAPPLVADGTQAVARWTVSGGPEVPPRLAVYPGGWAVADATYRLRLSDGEVADLVAHLTADLAGSGSPASGTPDAPVTQFMVRSGHRTTWAVVPDPAATAAYRDARDRLDAVYRRVTAGGQRYTGTRVRIVVGPDQAGDGRPWPNALPLPVGETPGAPMTEDLSGDAAGAAATLPRAWTRYRTASGEPVRATWRWLLPDE